MTPNDPPVPSAPGLPPVTPPSGRFIAQLFLVPGMIVLVAVLIIFGINYLFVGGYNPQYFLGKLDSDNADIRWRGASDLAQHIKRAESKQLKTDAAFALDLAERLHAALDELAQQEKALRANLDKLPDKERDRAWRKLTPQRDYVEYLTSALGDFYVPVGVPLLCEIINREDSPDDKGNTLRRRRAIWALSNLGAHVRAVAQEVPAEHRDSMTEKLQLEIAGKNARRSGWASTALHYLDKSAISADTAGLVFVDRALAQCAKTRDRYLREHVAMALNFWDGDLVETTLLQLSRDDGFGTLLRVAEGD